MARAWVQPTLFLAFFLLILGALTPSVYAEDDNDEKATASAGAADPASGNDDDDDEDEVAVGNEAPEGAEGAAEGEGAEQKTADNFAAKVNFAVHTPVAEGEKYVAGKRHTFLVGVRNTDVVPVTLYSMNATAFSIEQNQGIFNFTGSIVNEEIQPQQEVTVSYDIVPVEGFVGLEFPVGIMITPLLVKERMPYYDVAYNGTFSVVDPPFELNQDTLTYYATVILIIAVVAYMVNAIFFASSPRPTSSKASAPKKRVEIGTKTALSDDKLEWISGHLQPATGGRRRKR